MRGLDTILESLARSPVRGYQADQRPSSEPTALSALALIAHGRAEASAVAARWLADLQADDGSVGIARDAPWPRWPTALAGLVWQALSANDGQWSTRVEQAVQWSLSLRGRTLQRASHFGHDATLAAWPWVEGTHSWIEPTCLHLIALKAALDRPHPRMHEALELLLDRQLDAGGCNYGNTWVLGQELRPHVQPSGLFCLALAQTPAAGPPVAATLAYLNREVRRTTAITSLGWALLGLTAHRALEPLEAIELMQHTVNQRNERRPLSPYQEALVALVAAGRNHPLNQRWKNGA